MLTLILSQSDSVSYKVAARSRFGCCASSLMFEAIQAAMAQRLIQSCMTHKFHLHTTFPILFTGYKKAVAKNLKFRKAVPQPPISSHTFSSPRTSSRVRFIHLIDRFSFWTIGVHLYPIFQLRTWHSPSKSQVM